MIHLFASLECALAYGSSAFFVVVRIFRCVNDYLVFHGRTCERGEEFLVETILQIFHSSSGGLDLTVEKQDKEQLRFLALQLTFACDFRL